MHKFVYQNRNILFIKLSNFLNTKYIKYDQLLGILLKLLHLLERTTGQQKIVEPYRNNYIEVAVVF